MERGLQEALGEVWGQHRFRLESRAGVARSLVRNILVHNVVQQFIRGCPVLEKIYIKLLWPIEFSEPLSYSDLHGSAFPRSPRHPLPSSWTEEHSGKKDDTKRLIRGSLVHLLIFSKKSFSCLHTGNNLNRFAKPCFHFYVASHGAKLHYRAV